MWERRVETSGDFRFRVFGSHGAGPTKNELKTFWLCTYEHVIPRSKGAFRLDLVRDVATCRQCNCLRDRHDYARFRELVRLGNKPAAVAKLMRDETP